MNSAERIFVLFFCFFAHGTSTPAGDTSEAMAISRLFGEHVANMPINSIKSMTGHLLGGSSAIEAVATVLTLRDGIIPPTINHFNDDPTIDPNLDIVYWEARKKDKPPTNVSHNKKENRNKYLYTRVIKEN